LWLVKNGVPFDVAFSLDDTDRLAWTVVCGEQEGGVFDWSRGKWEDRKS